MPLEKRMPISQNENIGNFDLFSNITEGMGVGCGQGFVLLIKSFRPACAGSESDVDIVDAEINSA